MYSVLARVDRSVLVCCCPVSSRSFWDPVWIQVGGSSRSAKMTGRRSSWSSLSYGIPNTWRRLVELMDLLLRRLLCINLAPSRIVSVTHQCSTLLVFDVGSDRVHCTSSLRRKELLAAGVTWLLSQSMLLSVQARESCMPWMLLRFESSHLFQDHGHLLLFTLLPSDQGSAC